MLAQENHKTEFTGVSMDPVVAQKSPFAVDVQEGKTYYWCACGRSAKQPFCDGSHKDTGFTPLAYKAEKTGKAYFCGCKMTGTAPLCNGAHNKL
jgi:CDGSH-type Zn-finger protein